MTFDIVLADPPWHYDHNRSKTRRVERFYPTMRPAEICALPVQALAATDALLFLWATSPKLDIAIDVMRAWGFSYRTCGVWRKPYNGMGYYFRQRHELLLIGRRGRFAAPIPSLRTASVFDAPRGRHSEKPACVQELIERWYPAARKVELFAREHRSGWSAWGNEINSDVELAVPLSLFPGVA